MRPVFFAPWWWFFWSGGKRFSLRRGLSLALAVVILAEVVSSAARYAFRGEIPSLSSALAVARVAALASAAYSLVEPIFYVCADSLQARLWAPARLGDVSYGMQTAYAAAIAFGSYALAPHVALLEGLLVRARANSGEIGGDLRYFIGATILALPVVILLRALLLNVRAAPHPKRAPRVLWRSPFVDRRRIDAAPVAPPVAIRPARIISVETEPTKPPDGP